MYFLVQFFLYLFLVPISYVIYLFYIKNKARKQCQWIPQAPRVPLLGSIFEFGDHTETLKDITRLINNPKKMSYFEIINHRQILTANYDLIEFILSSNTMINKSQNYDFLMPWLGTGLLTAPGKKWKARRKMITPAFHFSILEQFVDTFDENANIMINKLKKEAVDKDSVDIYKYVNPWALDTICESAMGVNMETQSNKHQDYVDAVKDQCRIVLTRIFSAWKGSNLLFRLSEDYRKQQENLKILNGFTKTVIHQRKKEMEENKEKGFSLTDNLGRKRKLAFLDLLLNSTIDGMPLTNEDIQEEVNTFMFEGHDTTSSAVSSTLYLLANHPDKQKLVRDEQKQIYGSDKDRPTTYQDLQKMSYLHLVIKEALRLYPPVPMILRDVSEDTNFKGHILPKGTTINIFIYGISRDPSYYKNPDEFIPERFLDTSGKNPYLYVPFSAGPRNCIGQKFTILEMKNIISKLIRNFEIYPTDPPHQMLLSNEAVLKSLNGVKIKLKNCQWNK